MYKSVTDEFTDSTNPISKPNSAWICHIQLKLWPFVIYCLFRPKLGCHGNLFIPLQSEMKGLLFIGRPRKPPVISNHVLAFSCRNAFICIYSNFSPKIGCHGNAPLSLVYGSVTDEFPDDTNPISKPNYAWICHLQLKFGLFCDFLAYFGQNLVAMATPLRPLQSEMSSSDWSTTKTPCYK